MLIDDDWWQDARKLLSPNHDTRPVDDEISLLVIHNISLPPGQFGGGFVEQFFTNQLAAEAHPYFADICQMKVSAHCFIDRHGFTTQFVPFNLRAWHAGVSDFCGRKRCNDFSIGIELEGTDTDPYTDAQYQTLQALTRYLIERYRAITRDRIVGHSDIAPGRKTDPGPGFDWDRFLRHI